MTEPVPTPELAVVADELVARAMLALARRDQRPDAIAPLRDRIGEATARRDHLATDQRPLTELRALFALSPTEHEFLWATVAYTVEPRVAIHAEAIGGSVARRGLTVATFAELYEVEPRAARELAASLAADHPLVDDGLLRCTDTQPVLGARPFQAAARLVAYASGRRGGDPLIREQVADDGDVFDAAQRATLDGLASVLARPGAIAIIEGPSGAGRATALAHAAGRRLAILDLGPRVELEPAIRALRCAAVLDDALPVVRGADDLDADHRHQLGRLIDRWPATIAIICDGRGLDLAIRRPVVRLAWPVPTIATRARLWETLGQARPGPSLEALAVRYPIGPGTIRRATASARLLAPEAVAFDAATLETGLRHNIAERMGGIATRVEVGQSWADLIVADELRAQLDALIARVRYAHHVLERWGYRGKAARGGGVAALLSGPPGTGKTMVAGLVARELDLELYQVDLSQVVSKWVGETEKHLARVFDAAEQGHALLLFDEADALFGQRTTETRDAVDRYANLEVNFLLQRVESFGGVTILTTNLDTAIDPALKRRLASHIVFDLPDEDERAQLWRRLLTTAQAPLADDHDLAQLARDFPKMSGANIRNAALAAAFLAAADGAPAITHEHVLRAARVEYRSMGHVLADRRR